MKNKKARIVEVRVGVKTYWTSQIQKSFIFKYWVSLAHVFLNGGSVSWYESLTPNYAEAEQRLHDYEALYGIKLDITVVNLK